MMLNLLMLVLAQDWTGFRGPTGDGVAAADAAPPLEWSESRNVAWKAALPGRGRSSPVVLGGRIYLTGAHETGVQRKKIGPDDMQTAEKVVLNAVCIEFATGKILWEAKLREVDRPDPVHWLNSWATPTPVVEAGLLICDFGGMGTWGLDPGTGKTLWQKDIPLDHQVGPGSSLLLLEDRFLMVRDGRDAQYVAAFDKKTGERLWRTERPPVKIHHPNMKKSFSSPLRIESGGKIQIVAVGPHWAAAYDPEGGKELWRARHGEGFSIGTVPVYGEGLVYFGTGCMRPSLVAVRADGQGDVTESHIAWRSQKSVPVMSSPVRAGGDLYWVSDDGMATCADPRTGVARWQTRFGEGHLASPLVAAGRVYFFGREGKTTVVQPGPECKVLAENKVDGTVIASPAAVGNSLVLRSDTHLYRLAQ
jgi:outer membrane protein assembly factor BamB